MSEQADLFGYRDLREAKESFFKAMHEGEKRDCPCCGRHSQIYKRKITGEMIQLLLRLYRKAGNTESFVHFSEFMRVNVSHDISALKYFGLIEIKPNKDDESKKTSGFWRITYKGVSFLNLDIKLEKYALIFDDKIIGFSGDAVSAKECMPENFNYQELMEGK